MSDAPKLAVAFFDLGGTLVTIDKFSMVTTGLKGAQTAYRRLQDAGANMPGSVVFYQKVLSVLGKAGIQASSDKEIRLDEKIAELFESLGKPLTEKQLRIAVAAWHEPFAAQVKARPGVRETLEALRDKGLRLAVISNSSWPGWVIEEEIEQHGLAGLFDPVIVSSETGFKKPHPEIFEIALKTAGCAAGESAFVGNSLREDVSGARYVGMRTLYYNESGEPDDAGLADAEISDLAGLVPAIENWL